MVEVSIVQKGIFPIVFIFIWVFLLQYGKVVHGSLVLDKGHFCDVSIFQSGCALVWSKIGVTCIFCNLIR